MSDEESFVILGTSPTASMETVDSSLLATDSMTKDQDEGASSKTSTYNDLECQLTEFVTSSSTSQYTVVNKSIEHASESIASKNALDKVETKSLEKPMQNSGSSNSSVGENLAASFIMGEVDSNVLKSSLSAKFPSVLSPTPPVSHTNIPKDFLEQYEKMKCTVYKDNQILKSVTEQFVKWKKDFHESNAKLRNENMQLRGDLEQIQLNEKLRIIDQEEFIRSISEKQAVINNMSAQIEKLEHQLHSFEYIPKNDQETSYQAKEPTEYITRVEYQTVVKDLERRLSELYAENLELKDMQKQYIDELNCLKVNLEESQNKAQSDISMLTAHNVEIGEVYTKCENDCKILREEVSILRQQLDIYSKDFKIEQEAKENLANEKDQLISDLRDLQKKNQELIKEAQRNYEEHARQTMAPTGAFPKRRTLPDPTKLPQSSSPLARGTTTHTCPLCARNFKTLSVLQEHVNQCLDGN